MSLGETCTFCMTKRSLCRVFPIILRITWEAEGENLPKTKGTLQLGALTIVCFLIGKSI